MYQSICKDNTFLYTYLILFLVEHFDIGCIYLIDLIAYCPLHS
jgi:hypothetical protein